LNPDEFWLDEEDECAITDNSEVNFWVDPAIPKHKRSTGDFKKTYFVRHLDTNAIKIGRSRNPRRRLRELRHTFGGRMELLGFVDEHMAETCLIGYLKAWSLGSEWFFPSYEVLTVMETCLDRGYAEGLRLARYYAFAKSSGLELL